MGFSVGCAGNASARPRLKRSIRACFYDKEFRLSPIRTPVKRRGFDAEVASKWRRGGIELPSNRRRIRVEFGLYVEDLIRAQPRPDRSTPDEG